MSERVFSCVSPSALQKLVCLSTEVGERTGGDGKHILRRGRRGKRMGWRREKKGGGGGTEPGCWCCRIVWGGEEEGREKKITCFFCGQKGGYPVMDCGCKELRQTSRYFSNRFWSCIFLHKDAGEGWFLEPAATGARAGMVWYVHIDGEGGRGECTGNKEGGRRVLRQLNMLFFFFFVEPRCITTIQSSVSHK